MKTQMGMLLVVGALACFAASNVASAQGTRRGRPQSNDQDMMAQDMDEDEAAEGEDEGRPPFGPPNGMNGPGRGQHMGPPPGGQSEDLALIKKTSPELYKLIKSENDLDRRIMAAAMKYRRASQDKRSSAKEDLQKLVAEQFDVSQQRRTLELKWRAENKDKIIEKRSVDLLNAKMRGGQRGTGRSRMGPPDMPPPGFGDTAPRDY